jgi:hypothetical protein
MPFRILTDFIQADVITNFIIDNLEKSLVAINVVTTHSQAELGYGSSYKIPGAGNLTLTQYNGTPVTPQALTQSAELIAIDKYPFINFYLNDSDVNEATALSVAGVYAQRAAYQIAENIDRGIFSGLYTGSTKTTSTSLGVTSGAIIVNASNVNVLDYLERFATVLKEANAHVDAVITIPSFMATALAKEVGIKVQNDSIAGSIANGFVARLFGLDIYESNNMPTGVAGGLIAGEYAVLGGKRDAYHYVQGTTIAKSGNSETNPATWNQLGQVWGSDYSQPLGYYAGVVKKA